MQDRLADINASIGAGLWAVGVFESSKTMQAIGLAIGALSVAGVVSREIRLWMRGGSK